MWNILIVDDEKVAVEGIKLAIDKKRYPIDTIFAAYDIEEAQRTVDSHKIHILICDIEMPGGSGLELLEWVKERHENIVSFILTSHADFLYAQRAVSLKVMQYLLKPISNIQIEQMLDNAMEKLNGTRKENTQWIRVMREQFFDSILFGARNSGLEWMSHSKFQKLCIKKEQEYVLTLFCLEEGEREEKEEEKKIALGEELALFSVQNIVEELLLKEKKNYVVLKKEENMLFLILFAEEFERQLLDQILKSTLQYVRQPLSCYYGKKTKIQGLLEEKNGIVTAKRNNALSQRGVFLAETFQGKEINYQELDGDLIAVLLRRKKFEAAYDYLKHHLEAMLNMETMQEGIMRRFCEDISKIFHQNFQDLWEIFHTEEYLSRKAEASKNMELCLKWVQYALWEFRNRQRERCETSPEKIAMEYIERHLDEELTCKGVAAYVGIHHDYLSKLMKREKGMTLQQYIDEMKLKKAKNLLIDTDIPATTISQAIGYRHYTYFSTYFKKKTNLSPTEFRKAYHKTVHEREKNEKR